MAAEDRLSHTAERLSIWNNPEDGEDWLLVEGEGEEKHTYCKTALWLAREVKNWQTQQPQQQPPPPPTNPYASSSQQPPPQVQLVQTGFGVGVPGQHSRKDPHMREWRTFSNQPYMGRQISSFNEIEHSFQLLYNNVPGGPPRDLEAAWRSTRAQGYTWYRKHSRRADRHAVLSVCSCCRPCKDQTNIGRSHSFVFVDKIAEPNH